MSRSAKARSRRNEVADVQPRVGGRAIVALTVYAVALLVACLIPFARAGNPYPDGIGTYWALGVALLVGAGIASRLSFFERHTLRIPSVSPTVLSLGLIGATVVLSSIIALEVFGGGANTSDEIAQLWHAKILLSGRLFLPPDPNPEFFSLETVVDRGRWYSQFPIGGAIVAIPGALTGMPWLTNSVLAGFSAVLLYRFGQRAYGEGLGRLGAFLFVL